jgi:D-sedoheptulose 7-phosphate isomerase
MKLFIPYLSELNSCLAHTVATTDTGSVADINSAILWHQRQLQRIPGSVNKQIIIGNGGSAAIASHMAIDYSKNGGIRSLSFNDSSLLTCLGNDFGYEHVFAEAIRIHALPGDLLVAISSSGQSKNILNAVTVAKSLGCQVLTMSGFQDDNPLRTAGHMNLYVPSDQYGFVEIAHLALLHAALDLLMGWGKPSMLERQIV